jgi:hypothetical protein
MARRKKRLSRLDMMKEMASESEAIRIVDEFARAFRARARRSTPSPGFLQTRPAKEPISKDGFRGSL